MSHFHQPRPAPFQAKANNNNNNNFKDCHPPSSISKPSFFQTPQPAVHQPKPRPHCNKPDNDHYLFVTEDQIMNFLECYDENRDGFLNKCELTKAFEDLGAFFPEWRTGRALAVADKDCDGHIGLDELEDVLLYAKKSGYKINC